MDLYADALAFPRLLAGQFEPASRRGLVADGATAGQLRWQTGRRRLQRAHHGVYLVGDGLVTLLDRINAALLAAPPGAVVGLHTAAMLYGFGVVASDAVHIVVPAGTAFPQRPGIAAHQVVVPVGEPFRVLGVPLVPPARCAVDLARSVRRADALAVLDAALFSAATVPGDLAAEVARHDRLRGVCQAREAVSLADDRAECRQESHLRLVLHDGGVRGIVPQLSVGGFRMDLGDPLTQVGVEYDGASHATRERLRGDRHRHNWLDSHGWTMRYFTYHDLYQRPDYIVASVKAAQRSRRTSARVPSPPSI